MQGKLNESVGCFERALRLVEKGRPANEDFRLCTAHTRQPLNGCREIFAPISREITQENVSVENEP